MPNQIVKTEFASREEWLEYLRSIGLARTDGDKVLKKFYSATDGAWVQYEV